MDAFFGAVEQALDLGAWYQEYPWAIDGLVYLVLFTGLAKVSLGRRFEGRGGMAVVAATGTALAVGAATWARASGFSLVQLGAPAWLIVLTLLGILIFDLARSVGLPLIPSTSAAVLIVVATAGSLGHALSDWISSSGLGGIIRLLALAAVLALAFWVSTGTGGRRMFKRDNAGAGPSDPAPPPPSGPVDPAASLEVQADTRAILTVESDLAGRLTALIERVRRHGVDPSAGQTLAEIRRRERMVTTLYTRVLRVLAERRWKAGTAQDELPEELRRLLMAAKTNLSEFDRLMEVARAACQAGNAPLLLGALQRMLRLELQALDVSRSLLELLRRLRSGQSQSSPARTMWGDRA